MSLYQKGLSLQSTPRRHPISDAARDFHTGSRRFYNRGVSIGAASGTFLGTAADGIVAIIMDALHIILMIGGALFIFRTLAGHL